jgi:hypothetical protein
MWLRVLSLFAVCCTVALGPRASAQSGNPQQGVSVTIVDNGETPSPGPSGSPGPSSSPGPTGAPGHCLETRDAAGNPQDTFPEQGFMRVFLAAGCAEPHEVDIEIDIESSPVLYTHANADGTGGFLTGAKQLPAPVRAGPHEVVAKTIDHTYSVPMTVTSATGASVLGQSIIRGRPLPHTGEDLIRLLLIAAGLAVIGAILIGGSRRLRRSP